MGRNLWNKLDIEWEGARKEPGKGLMKGTDKEFIEETGNGMESNR